MIRLVLKGNDFQRWIDLFNYLFNYDEILFLQTKRETIRNFVKYLIMRFSYFIQFRIFFDRILHDTIFTINLLYN